jgi:hypothetical protein
MSPGPWRRPLTWKQRRYLPPALQRRIELSRLMDDRPATERGCAIVVYDPAFALEQEWHEEAVRRRNIMILRRFRA